MADKKIMATIVAAVAASLCCITPVLAVLVGSSSLASSFSWMQPYHNYLVGVTILVLLYAWWDKLKTKKDDINCACDVESKIGFFSSKKFLAIVTLFSIIMLSFPLWGYKYFNTEAECNSCTVGNEVKKPVNNLPVLKYMSNEKANPTACNQQACTGTGNKELDAMLADARTEVEEMSPAVLKKMLDNGEDVTLLDVRGSSKRTKAEIYTDDESYAISRCDLEFKVLGTIDNKNTVVVVYSRLGARSLLAAQAMKHLGYKNVYNLTAGVKGWARAGYPFSEDEKPVIKSEGEI
ncbi:rhodanese-like domain-containing protein [Candidatus Sulfurimonas marisnigri]|uniref:Mercuric transport protein MerT n=1 Tax=Candidatus Sulfurimonas marisnigri TaxID=2740405 RepID=A0A7S7RNX4_9BACT|nr:mercuric transporter MerT family protein [Candidatus Sulfurimonas marisnigri]QOY53742.1 rhodanese-like domain-containing protein [Candidatus Sulfurimonas marisnigri]